MTQGPHLVYNEKVDSTILKASEYYLMQLWIYFLLSVERHILG